MITLVITSCGRLELLKKTISSFNQMNTYPMSEVIIIEDSCNKELHKQLCDLYPDYTLILNGKNQGLINNIDRAYSLVKTKYVFHCEDDWQFTKPGFMEQSLNVIENNHMVMQVWISNVHNQLIDPEIHSASGVHYQYATLDGMHHIWHGFTLNPGLRSMRVYKEAAPWSQWSTDKDFLALRECKIGEEYLRKGYRAAVLQDTYCVHTGGGQSTWC